MRYKKASDIFPQHILAFLQEYVDGEYVYFPRKDENRKHWGDNTHTKTDTLDRNIKIYTLYKQGFSVKDLALAFYLSEKSIQRIITWGKKKDNTQ